MEQPELSRDPLYATHQARGDRQAELDDLIANWTQRHPAHELWNTLNLLGVPAGPIYSIADIAKDPQFAARGMIREMDDPELGCIKAPGIVPQLSETPGVLNWTGPPQPGSHNPEIYSTLLEMSAAEMAELTKQGII